MLPLYLLTAAKNQPMLVELKSGETLNGHLINCDSWMNLTLRDVIQSSAGGDQFLLIPECYVRGNHIKYLRLPDEIMDQVKEANIQNMEQRNFNRHNQGRNNRGNFRGNKRYNNQGGRNQNQSRGQGNQGGQGGNGGYNRGGFNNATQ
ncbi:hypothetical protein BABINDRAFT_8367 [Babjeviella inositovora NRRL Y-12698]|uniref:LSM complex subunit LSM4 n=1 Tax=Babjeviella inositovora NRRL Y-12698 TaxID=984486 RepID=A0A1E3QPP4_9ASCO|nr:uncharacterized protein BABINDRAFT_8367 [Babjeviella inositovora NRRL Y-12698]ODQ79434.1 hypothetical protein BABINDRAFT_8367 [Babjeviella inositovora NRRL Y-12698]